LDAPPFVVSPEAQEQILGVLERIASDSTSPTQVPALFFGFRSMKSDMDGRCFAVQPYPFFALGCYARETVASGGFVEFELAGHTLVAHPETLRRLEGKRLVLETVDVGFPNPGDMQDQILRARPLEPEPRGD
jgi:hypothetical protein